MTASVADLKFLEIETGTQNISSTPSSSKQKISYLDLGDKNSIPLLFFHGFPGSALQSLIFYPHLESYGVRLIAMNRPGYASSSMMRPTSPKAFVSVVQDFVDALELEKFICVGVSGGNPYAIATASVLKSRVLGLGSICGAAPFNSETMSMMNPLSNLFLSLSKVLPSSVIEVIAGKILNSQEPHKRIVKLLGKLPHVDRALFEDKN